MDNTNLPPEQSDDGGLKIPQWLKDKLKKYSELVGVKLSLLGILVQEFLKESADPPYMKLGYAALMVTLVVAAYFEVKEE